MDAKVAFNQIEEAIKDFTGKFGGRLEAHGDELVALRQQVVELAQKSMRMPFSGLGGGGGEIASALSTHKQAFEEMAGGQRKNISFSIPTRALNLKTTILGPTTPGAAALQAPDRAQDFVAPAMQRLTVLALLPSLPTNAGATSYTEVATTTSGAAIQGADSSPLGKEGEIIGESGFTYSLQSADVVTIATWIPASAQVLEDMSALQRQIDTWLRYFLALKAETEVLTGSGSGQHISGLTNQATAYNRGATDDTRADTLRKAVTQLLLANHAPSGIVLHPADDEALDLLKDTTGQYLRVNVGGRVWDVPRITSNSMSSGQFLVGNFEAALVRPRQETIIEISNSHDDYFTRMLVAIRASMRMALEVHMPTGFVLGSF